MKVQTILLLVAFLILDATGFSQKITLDKINATLEEVLINIHKQTGYSYTTNSESLKNAKRIDIHVKELSLEQVLTIALKDQPLTWSIKDKIIIIKGNNQIDFSSLISPSLYFPPDRIWSNIKMAPKCSNKTGYLLITC